MGSCWLQVCQSRCSPETPLRVLLRPPTLPRRQESHHCQPVRVEVLESVCNLFARHAVCLPHRHSCQTYSCCCYSVVQRSCSRLDGTTRRLHSLICNILNPSGNYKYTTVIFRNCLVSHCLFMRLVRFWRHMYQL
jgi:hypothetical protein